MRISPALPEDIYTGGDAEAFGSLYAKATVNEVRDQSNVLVAFVQEAPGSIRERLNHQWPIHLSAGIS